MEPPHKEKQGGNIVVLCASCDRCRSRKTRCDGKRPCGNCVTKYMKNSRLMSAPAEGTVSLDEFECVYSPAKRRGPNPGRASNNATAVISGTQTSSSHNNNNAHNKLNTLQHSHKVAKATTPHQQEEDPPYSPAPIDQARSMSDTHDTLPRSIAQHMHLLNPMDLQGNTLRSKFHLAVTTLLQIPETHFDDEDDTSPTLWAACTAVRFAVVAVGAIISSHDDTILAMELCNASVHCLQDAVRGTSADKASGNSMLKNETVFQMSKAYFYLGIFRAFRGDMVRYFKYRRVTLSYLSQLPNDERTYHLVGAISYLDAWAYMIYNASEEELPVENSDAGFSFQASSTEASLMMTSETESKYSIKMDVPSIVCNPTNVHWIQGAPPIFLNIEAPVPCRVLDALSCVFRTCCDRANDRFCEIGVPLACENPAVTDNSNTRSHTATAVLAHENELCSRNVVLSAKALLQQCPNEGQQMVASSLDAFFENQEGFTDAQIHTLLVVGKSCLENPLTLYHPGPTYHMVCNTAIMLAHIHNNLELGTMENKQSLQDSTNDEECNISTTTVKDEVLEIYTALRSILTIHRRKLPSTLQCHWLPRATTTSNGTTASCTIDLGETILCACRSCQGFVLAACSPCVAAERAAAAARQRETLAAQEAEAMQLGEIMPCFGDDDDDEGDLLLEILNAPDFSQ